MTDSANVRIVQDAYAAFGRSDVSGILAACTDDIDWQFYGPSELPMAGPRRGKNEVGKFFEQVAAAWNFERFEPRQFIEQGDTVIALGWYSGRSKQADRPFGCEWAHVFTLRGGKVARFREYSDTANLIAAFSPSLARR